MRRSQSAIIAVIALAGILVSGQWLVVCYKSWPGVMLERKINRGETVSGEALVRVWEKTRNLDQIFLPGSHVHLPGLVSRLVVIDTRLAGKQRAEALLVVQDSTVTALVREPANSAAWARLSWLNYIDGGPSSEVVSALRMSIYAAPAKRSLLHWRIRMADLNREYWDEQFEDLVKRQIVYAAQVSRRQLNQMVAGTGMEAMAREILDSDFGN